MDGNNLIHNIDNYNNLQVCLRRLAVNKMATNIWRYFTLRMRDYPWHISIRLAYINSILSSINIYPLLNTVLKNYIFVFLIGKRRMVFYRITSLIKVIIKLEAIRSNKCLTLFIHLLLVCIACNYVCMGKIKCFSTYNTRKWMLTLTASIHTRNSSVTY